jgi:hypothetical protein
VIGCAARHPKMTGVRTSESLCKGILDLSNVKQKVEVGGTLVVFLRSSAQVSADALCLT